MRTPTTTRLRPHTRHDEDDKRFDVRDLNVYVSGCCRAVTVTVTGKGADHWGGYLLSLLKEDDYRIDRAGFVSPSEPPPTPSVRSTDRVPLKSIKVEWSESNLLENGHVYDSWAEAESDFRAAALAHKGGGYDKTKFVITWADGEVYEGRIDLNSKDQSLIGHIRNFQLHIMDPKNLGKFNWTEEDQESARKLLADYLPEVGGK